MRNDEAIITRLYLEGMSAKSIGAQLGIAPDTARAVVRANDLDRKMFEARADRMYFDFKKGLSFDEISVLHKVTPRKTAEFIRMKVAGTKDLESCYKVMARAYLDGIDTSTLMRDYRMDYTQLQTIINTYAFTRAPKTNQIRKRPPEQKEYARDWVGKFRITTDYVMVLEERDGWVSVTDKMVARRFCQEYAGRQITGFCIKRYANYTMIYLKGIEEEWKQ